MPDDKDWTWVLDRRCGECGFDAAAVAPTDVAQMTRDASAKWADVLTTRADVRDRPRPEVWSPLEYGCHVRDVHRVYTSRLERMLTEDGPRYDNWDQDDTAIAAGYGQQNPATVADDLVDQGTTIADVFDSVHGDQWQRTGVRSDGAAFTIDTMSRYFLHDIVHHLHDVHA